MDNTPKAPKTHRARKRRSGDKRRTGLTTTDPSKNQNTSRCMQEPTDASKPSARCVGRWSTSRRCVCTSSGRSARTDTLGWC